ncbi:MAG: molecular chaperone SurA [Gammaproteobacteria bacterium SG8_47]|nr:MAG: molecular chaperone SurA [Gammaproteobacteria bacterium SG8_47]
MQLDLGLNGSAKAKGPQELDRIVALVNDDIITKTELDRQLVAIEVQLRRQNVRMPPPDVLRRQVLERMIVQRIQLQLAERGGIRVDEETLNQVMNKIALENGISLMELPRVLARDGIEFADFRENIRDEMITSRVQQQQVMSRITVTEQEVDNYLTNAATRRGADIEYRLAHILIGVPEGATPDVIGKKQDTAQQVVAQLHEGADFEATAVAVSEGQKALEGGDLGWRSANQLPSIFADQIAPLNVGEIVGPIRSPAGFHIIKLVDKRTSAARTQVTESLVRHILIETNQVTGDEEARSQLQALRERIVAGEDFAALARQYSADKGSAVEGGSVGWVRPGVMVPEFEQTMQRTAPGEISQPFRSGFGWHILQVMSRRSLDNTEQAERDKAREAIQQRKAEEALQSWLRRIRDEAYVEYRTDA